MNHLEGLILVYGPAIRALPSVTSERLEEIACICGGVPVEAGNVRGVYLDEQLSARDFTGEVA